MTAPTEDFRFLLIAPYNRYMQGFELLEHPSDIGLLARGNSRDQALIEVSKGLTSVMVDPIGIRALERRVLQVTGEDQPSQIVNWLNEILFLFDTEGLIFGDFEIDSWTATVIRGQARGERFDSARHDLRTAVKAATYHQFDIRESEGGLWEVRVFVDV
jgi:SHS2 domain-containing protein